MFSLIEALIKDPLWFLSYSLYRIPAVLIALVLHEWAHGYVAFRLGDPTAKMMGRLTLNPLKHLDPVGAILMFLVGFGWAKPVPIDPRYYKRPHRDDLLVSIAGITMNLILFTLFTLLAVGASYLLWEPQVMVDNPLRDLLGYDSTVMNTILSGSGHVYSARYFQNPGMLWAVRLTSQIAMVNLYIAVFNLLPVPPLDGSHVVNDLIFKKNLFVSRQLAGAGMGIVLLLSMTGWLGKGIAFLGNLIQSGLLYLVAAGIGGF